MGLQRGALILLSETKISMSPNRRRGSHQM
jgi:hypothetical protein